MYPCSQPLLERRRRWHTIVTIASYTRSLRYLHSNHPTKSTKNTGWSLRFSSIRRGRGFEHRIVGSARASQTTEPSAGRKPATRAKRQYMNVSNYCRRNLRVAASAEATARRRAIRRRRRGRHARKTAKAPVLMVKAWARTPSIGRTEMPRPVCEVARSAPADAACLGSGSATKTLVHARIGRLSVVAGTTHARWMW